MTNSYQRLDDEQSLENFLRNLHESLERTPSLQIEHHLANGSHLEKQAAMDRLLALQLQYDEGTKPQLPLNRKATLAMFKQSTPIKSKKKYPKLIQPQKYSKEKNSEKIPSPEASLHAKKNKESLEEQQAIKFLTFYEQQDDDQNRKMAFLMASTNQSSPAYSLFDPNEPARTTNLLPRLIFKHAFFSSHKRKEPPLHSEESLLSGNHHVKKTKNLKNHSGKSNRDIMISQILNKNFDPERESWHEFFENLSNSNVTAGELRELDLIFNSMREANINPYEKPMYYEILIHNIHYIPTLYKIFYLLSAPLPSLSHFAISRDTMGEYFMTLIQYLQHSEIFLHAIQIMQKNDLMMKIYLDSWLAFPEKNSGKLPNFNSLHFARKIVENQSALERSDRHTILNNILGAHLAPTNDHSMSCRM